MNQKALFCIISCFAFCVYPSFINAQSKKCILVNMDASKVRPSPSMAANLPNLESMGFHGITVTPEESWYCMKANYKVQAYKLDSCLAYLDGKFTTFTDNYINVMVDRPCDFFDDWTQVITNWKTIAEVTREHGYKGIFFDNEEYSIPIFDYPKDCKHKDKSLQEYRTQAQLRGKQIMEAVVSVWPDIEFLTLHGPYASEHKPQYVTREQLGTPDKYELMAPFYVGMMLGSGTKSTFIDGGEIYQYRTLKDYRDSYSWRKYSMATESQNSPNIPTELRSQWTSKNEISFGLYPYAWPNKVTDSMNATIMRTTLENAMRVADSKVWYFFEKSKPEYVNGQLSREWRDAISGAIAAANDVSDKQAPNVPFHLQTSKIARTSVRLSWKAPTDNVGVAGYNIFKNGQWVGRVSDTTILITGLVCNSNYDFSATAFDDAYNYSKTSDSKKVKTAKCSVVTGINLLVNSGFESPLSIGWSPENWVADSKDTKLNSTNAHTGKNCLELGPNEGGRTQILNNTVLKEDSTYTLSAWCKIESYGNSSSIGVVCKDINGKLINEVHSTAITNTDVFERKIVTFTIPKNTVNTEVYVWHGKDSPNIFVDDFILISGFEPISE